MAKRGKRGLTDEDKALWNRVAATANPMDRRGAPTILESSKPSPAKSQHPTPEKEPAPAPAFRIGEKTVKTASAWPPSSQKPPPPPIRMDHGTHKRMARGKLKPEGRIDLHGMTLSEAHPALIKFIFQAYESQKRLVLVITGKGKDRDAGGPIPIRRGILRHQVPAWLTTPPLSVMILDIREAHQRHGGGGAFYVYLKRQR